MLRMTISFRFAVALQIGLILAAAASAQQTPDEASVLTRQAVNLYQEGRYADAVPPAQRALAIHEQALGAEHPLVAAAQSNLGEIYRAQGRYAEAETLFKRSLAIREKVLGPEHADVAASLNNLGGLYDSQGRYAEAEPLYQRALDVAEKALGPEHASVATSLNNLAALYASRGRYRAAEPLYARSLAIYEKALGPEHPSVARTLNNLAGLYRAQGRYAEGEPLYRRSLLILETALGPGHPSVATALNNLAGLHRTQGSYGEGEKLYRRSLAIYEKTLGSEHPATATTLSNLAGLYESQGRYAEAEPLYQRALTMFETAFGPGHVTVATALNNLAETYRAERRYAEAEPLYKRSLTILAQALDPGHPDLAASLNNLAGLYRLQGRHAEAEPLYARSLAIHEKALGPEHASVAATLNNLAGLYESQERYAEAEKFYARSLAIYEKALGPEHPSVATALNNLAGLHRMQGRHEEAFAGGRRAFAILHKRALTGAGLDRTGKDAERQADRASFQFFLSLAATQVGKVQDEAFAAMQLAAHSSADRALTQASLRFASTSENLARSVRQRQDAMNRIGALDKAIVTAASQPPDKREPEREQAMHDELAALDRTLAGIDAQLRQEFPEFAELSLPRPLSLDAVQNLLAADETLVAFTVAADAIYRFAVRRDRSEFRRIEVERSAIEEKILALRLALDLSSIQRTSDLGYYDTGEAHALYRILFDGADPILSGARRLMIVPDGPLGGLPFSLLPSKTPPSDAQGFARYRRVHWLMRDYAITVLPSIGSLRALRILAAKVQPPREPFLGFGDPDLAGRPGDVKSKARQQLAARGPVADVSAVRQLGELPDTAEELRRMARTLQADPVASTLLRAQATEQRVKATDLSRYRVLAFATHGLMADEFAGYGEPSLVLTPPEQGDETDDGLLSASEVAQLKLNADWVILSACNTAAPDGTPGAEGLSGLARAFFYAGSRALLVSHWPVLSDASVRLTTGAIAALANEPQIGRAEALRRSMLALLDDQSLPEEYAHPAIWAPFSLVGEGGADR